VRKKDFKKPLVGTSVYTQTGIKRDTIIGLEYDEKNNIITLLGEKQSFLPKELSMPDDILIIKRKYTPPSARNVQDGQIACTSQAACTPQDTNTKRLNIYNFARPDTYKEHLFLLDRVINKTIYYQTLPIITKGDKITYAHLFKAESARKLTEMIIFSE
jgi:hypothetical protein